MREKALGGKPVLLVEALASRNDSGLGNMVRLYVDGLRGLAGSFDIRVVLPADGSYRPAFPCQVILVRPKPMRLWTQIAFPLLILRHAPAAVFCLGMNLPAWRPASRYILAVPDAGPLEDLGWATSSHDPYNRRWLKRMAPKADAIVTLSDFTRSRLSALLAIPSDRIHVVRPVRPAGLGIGAAANGAGPVSGSGSVPGSYPPGDYFLALGNLEPRKNFPGLIAAYAELWRRRPDAPPLYIAGHKAWGRVAVEAAVEAQGLAGRVHLIGYLSEPDRKAYLAHCLAFVSSSRYEGWGLPLFEALSQGKPSVYHAGSSQEEFARGMALAVDCGDMDALSRALETLWTDEGERRRLAAAMRTGFGSQMEYDLEGALQAALLRSFNGHLMAI
jgi:glycosyltransferase involved in cell wall biosynthesis